MNSSYSTNQHDRGDLRVYLKKGTSDLFLHKWCFIKNRGKQKHKHVLESIILGHAHISIQSRWFPFNSHRTGLQEKMTYPNVKMTRYFLTLVEIWSFHGTFECLKCTMDLNGLDLNGISQSCVVFPRTASTSTPRNPKQSKFLIPCWYRFGTNLYPHKGYKLLDRSVLRASFE